MAKDYLHERDHKMTMDFIGSLIESKKCHFLGIADLKEDLQSFDRFTKWLDTKSHGSMTWLENYLPQRRDPSLVEEGCNKAILIGIPYFLGRQVVSAHQQSKVASYARYEDYHKFVTRTGKEICSELSGGLDPTGTHQWRAVSDSIPILERSLYSKFTGCFIGKNTMLIHPSKGSWFLLMEILTSFPLDSTPAGAKPLSRSSSGGCGTCRRCQVFCPTGALDNDYVLDASKCLSYLTIEHRDTVPLKYWQYFSKYWYGCDICQNVCPYNRSASEGSPLKLKYDTQIDLLEVVMMSQYSYETWFGGTPMTRAKRNGLRRNAFIAMAALQDERLPNAMAILRGDEDPMLNRTAEQALEFLNEKGS